MIVSDKVLPIRFYNNLYDQNRFNALCYNNCQLDLVYPPSRVPNFQFKRPATSVVPEQFIMRNVCTDIAQNYHKIIPEGADTFCNSELVKQFYTFSVGETISTPFPWQVPLQTIEPPLNFLVDLFDVDCCSFKMLSQNIPNYTGISYIPLSYPIISFPITPTDKYHFRIIVDKLCGTSSIQINNGATPIATITSAGTYDFYFTSTANNIQIIPSTIGQFDCMEISYMQATIVHYIINFPTDITLNYTQLQVAPLKNGTDVVTYCSSNSFTSNIPDGSYYYIVYSGGKEYYSEVFKIVSLNELQHYFKLEWWDDCDLNDSVIYNPSTSGGGGGGLPSCTLKNILYLDAALFKPSYDTIEESEVNGKGDLNVRFKKWQKSIGFEIGKSPEFLTDALSGIFLHKFVTITEPLNKYQDLQSQVSSIIKVTSEVSDILNECFQKVILNLLLDDKITDSACCNLADIFSCPPCKYEAGEIYNCGTYNYYMEEIPMLPACIGFPAVQTILRKCSDLSVVNVRDTDLICWRDKYYYLEYKTFVDCTNPPNTIQRWVIKTEFLKVISVSYIFVGFLVFGTIVPNTFARVYFQINCTGVWIYSHTIQVFSTGIFNAFVPYSDVQPYEPFTSVCFKVVNFTLNCELGESNSKGIGV